MDLSTVLATGFVSASFSIIAVVLTLRLRQDAIIDKVFDEVDGYIEALPKRFAENPQFIHDLFDPIMKELFKGLQVPAGQSGGMFKIPGTNIKLPAEVIAPFIQKFLGNVVKDKATEAVGGLLG